MKRKLLACLIATGLLFISISSMAKGGYLLIFNNQTKFYICTKGVFVNEKMVSPIPGNLINIPPSDQRAFKAKKVDLTLKYPIKLFSDFTKDSQCQNSIGDCHLYFTGQELKLDPASGCSGPVKAQSNFDGSQTVTISFS